jgi:hypothetical protein
MTMLLVAALPAAFALAGGCANTATCDPDAELRNGLCLPRGSKAKAKTPANISADGGVVQSDGGGDLTCGPGAPETGSFGTDCTTNGDCGCPAPVCAIQDGQAKGFCTQMGCGDDPSLCPSGWNCFDASVLNPDYPQICVKN